MTLVSLTGDVIRHTRTVSIRQTGDDNKVFMWNEDEILNLIGSVSEGFPSYSHRLLFRLFHSKQ